MLTQPVPTHPVCYLILYLLFPLPRYIYKEIKFVEGALLLSLGCYVWDYSRVTCERTRGVVQFPIGWEA